MNVNNFLKSRLQAKAQTLPDLYKESALRCFKDLDGAEALDTRFKKKKTTVKGRPRDDGQQLFACPKG